MFFLWVIDEDDDLEVAPRFLSERERETLCCWGSRRGRRIEFIESLRTEEGKVSF